MSRFMPPVYVRARPTPDFFEQVVGVPLEDWMAANTVEALNDLLARRDSPPPVETLSQHRRECTEERSTSIFDFTSPHAQRIICDCGASFELVRR